MYLYKCHTAHELFSFILWLRNMTKTEGGLQGYNQFVWKGYR